MFENKKIHPRIERISYLMTQKSPFFSEFLLRYSYYKTDKLPTMGTGIHQGRIVLFWNEEFVDKLDDDELEGVLIHEIYHIITLSQRRGKGRDRTLWNYATDAVNNESIISSTINGKKIILPKDSGIFMKHFYDEGYEGKVVSEEVYDFLNKNQEKYSFTISMPSQEEGEGDKEEENDGSGGSGKEEGDKKEEEQDSGSSSGNDEEKEDGVKIEIKMFDDHSSLSEEDLSEVEAEIIENMTKDAQTKGWGNFAGDLKRQVEELIKPKKAHISQRLKSKLSEYFSSSGQQTQTWKRKNRRGYPLPGKIRTKAKINVFIDNSGSCWNDRIASLFFGQLEEFIRMGYETSVYCFDTNVYTVKEKYNRGDYKKLTLPGGGGTAVQPIFDFIKEKGKERESSIILTDGYFNWGFDDYNIHTLWMLTENGYWDRAPKDRRFYLERS